MRAVIYIPTGADIRRWVPVCSGLAEARGWHVEALVRQWHEWVALVAAEMVDVGVVGTRAHLDPARLPRLEAADEQPTEMERRPSELRRARRLT